jgi:hypothetical protein
MRPLVAVLAILLIALTLAEFFTVFLLPRRVKRDPRFARTVFWSFWIPWRALARRLGPSARDTMLGLFGPLGLLGLVALWTTGIIVGFSALHWANHSALSNHGATSFGDDVFFSAGGFFSDLVDLAPHGAIARILTIAEVVSGFVVLFVVIGYLPALFQAYSRREVAVSQLDPRAGSPPSASRLLLRSGHLGGWTDVDAYMAEWETWAAELMETHLSYPILAFYRSQHVNQNWLAALVTVLDTSAFAIAAAPAATPAAETTFAIGRHALADLAYSFHAQRPKAPPERLDTSSFRRLCDMAQDGGLELADLDQTHRQLDELRAMYEPYAIALSTRLELTLSPWVGAEEPENWRIAAWRSRQTGMLH